MNRKKKKHIWRWALLAVAAVAILAFALIPRSNLGSYDATTVETGDLSTYYSFSGNVSAKSRDTYVTQSPVEIDRIYVEQGDVVDEDDSIIRLTGGRKLKSNIDGTLILLDAKKGDYVPAETTLYDVVDLNTLQVTIKVDEGDLGAVEIGNQVDVRFHALADKTVAGTVTDIAAAATVENDISYFTATVAIDYDEDIRLGLSAEVMIQRASVQDVITLPIRILLFDTKNQAYVYRMDENGDLVRQYLTLGINDGSTVEIISGLDAGETVYTPKDNAQIFSPMNAMGGDE